MTRLMPCRMGSVSRRVNWILDADIRSFFDEIDHEWMLRFLQHRIADRRMTPPDPQMAEGRQSSRTDAAIGRDAGYPARVL